MYVTKLLKQVGSDNTGATAVEYGLIVSLIVLAMVGALQSVANENNNVWNRVQDAGEEVMGG